MIDLWYYLTSEILCLVFFPYVLPIIKTGVVTWENTYEHFYLFNFAICNMLNFIHYE